MKKFFNFLQTDIPNVERIRAAINGCFILCLFTIVISLIFYFTNIMSGGYAILIAFLPFLIYISLYVDILIKFILIGLLQIFYTKIYDIFRKDKKQES